LIYEIIKSDSEHLIEIQGEHMLLIMHIVGINLEDLGAGFVSSGTGSGREHDCWFGC